MDEIDLLQASIIALISYVNVNDPIGFKHVLDTLLGNNVDSPRELRLAFKILADANADAVQKFINETKENLH